MLSVGTILKKERERKGLLLSDIEKQIKVREKYLKALKMKIGIIFLQKFISQEFLRTIRDIKS